MKLIIIFQCQLTRASSKSALNGSMMTLESEHLSHYSRKTGLSGESGQTGESGYGSGNDVIFDVS